MDDTSPTDVTAVRSALSGVEEHRHRGQALLRRASAASASSRSNSRSSPAIWNLVKITPGFVSGRRIVPADGI